MVDTADGLHDTAESPNRALTSANPLFGDQRIQPQNANVRALIRSPELPKGGIGKHIGNNAARESPREAGQVGRKNASGWTTSGTTLAPDHGGDEAPGSPAFQWGL